MHTKYDYNWQYYHIYQITCKDPTIKQGYVTNYSQRRKNDHQYRCTNENTKDYHSKLYNIIRDNGGFKKIS
jgi:hypothetical protein